jgi:stress response protein YsnF
MANFEEKNSQLRAELAAMKEDLAKAHDIMSTLMAAQEHPTMSVPVTTEVAPSIPLSTVTSDARFVMPNGRPYGLSAFYAPNTAAGISGVANQ